MRGQMLAALDGVPRVVVLAGSLGRTSRTARLADWCARRCRERGAHVSCFHGADLEFPFYRPDRTARDDGIRRYVAALEAADGVVLLSPSYHGTVSGLLKNALDYVNDLDGTPEPYLSDRPIGCIAVATGDQGAHSTLATLRTVAHALRGWPTPLGLALSGERAAVAEDGTPLSARTNSDLNVLLEQVLYGPRGVGRTVSGNGTATSLAGGAGR